MHLPKSLPRRMTAVAFCASLSALYLGGSTPILADSLNSQFDPATRTVRGSVPFSWDSGDTISLACSQTGTAVSLNLAVKNNPNGRLGVKVAFANPSVEWQAVVGDTPGQWVKHNGTETTKVYPGSDLTEIFLRPTVTGSTAVKKTQSVTGNPDVYFLNASNQWTALGHCNQGRGNATIALRHWTADWSASNSGSGKKGACFTNNSGSQMSLNQRIGVLSIVQSDATKVLYSNKTIDPSWFSADGKWLTLVSGSNTAMFDISTQNDIVWNGFHVWWGDLTVTATTDPIDLSKDYPKSAVQGIGGNPGIWIGIGNDATTDFFYLGRCNKI